MGHKCLANNKTMSKEASFGLEMEISCRELRVLLLHEFRLGRKATEAASNICSTRGKDFLKQLIEEDPRLTTRCLAEQLGCSHTTVEKHLKELGKTWKHEV